MKILPTSEDLTHRLVARRIRHVVREQSVLDLLVVEKEKRITLRDEPGLDYLV